MPAAAPANVSVLPPVPAVLAVTATAVCVVTAPTATPLTVNAPAASVYAPTPGVVLNAVFAAKTPATAGVDPAVAVLVVPAAPVTVCAAILVKESPVCETNVLRLVEEAVEFVAVPFIDIWMSLPFAAVSVSAPEEALAAAVTPVCEVMRLIAAATLAPCPAVVVPAGTAPMLMPLMLKTPAAMAVGEVIALAVPVTVLVLATAVTPDEGETLLMAVAIA